LEEAVAMMQQPFPELAYLEFRTDEDVVSTLPDSFLGGSAPCLVVRFPALSKLLLSTPVLLYSGVPARLGLKATALAWPEVALAF
jgi:hypothetical protein